MICKGKGNNEQCPDINTDLIKRGSKYTRHLEYIQKLTSTCTLISRMIAGPYTVTFQLWKLIVVNSQFL